MAAAEGEMRGCTDERQREEEGGREGETIVWFGQLEDIKMLYISVTCFKWDYWER